MIELTQTADGSFTAFNAYVAEHYHNVSGALLETQEIYLQFSELSKRYADRPVLRVLDPFFGLGYISAVLIEAVVELQKTQFPDAALVVVGVEYDPEILAYFDTFIESPDLNYPKVPKNVFEHKIYYQTQGDLTSVFQNLEKVEPGSINVRLIQGDLRQVIQNCPDGFFDLIYHDAFSVRKQPELWTAQLFAQYHRVLEKSTGATLTYSASAPVRKALQEAGFSLYALPRARDKSGTFAHVCHADYPALLPLEHALLTARSAIPYEDNEMLTLDRDEILSRREVAFQASPLPTSSAVHREHGYHSRFNKNP